MGKKQGSVFRLTREAGSHAQLFADIFAYGLGTELQGEGKFLLDGGLGCYQSLGVRGGQPLGFLLGVPLETRCQQQKFLRLSLCQDPVKQFGALFAVLDPGKTLPFYIGKDLFDVLG